jgi:hypothetical protein
MSPDEACKEQQEPALEGTGTALLRELRAPAPGSVYIARPWVPQPSPNPQTNAEPERTSEGAAS